MEGGILAKVLETVPEIFDLANTCFTEVIDNEVLLLYFSIGLIGGGLAVFRKMRRTVR